MKKYLLISMLLIFTSTIWGQATATLKIKNINVEYNGSTYADFDEMEVGLTDQQPTTVIIFDQDGVKYGVEFQYKKGRNRIKLVRRAFVVKNGMETKYGKKRKDMQELKTSITGSFEKRAVDNILISRENLEAINVSFKYELIYK